MRGLVIPEPHNNRALQCQLWMWEVPEAGLHLFLGPAHPQEGVPRACLQEGCQSPGQQAKQWWRRQWPWGFFQGHPQKGWQGSCHQLPGLKCLFSLSAFTMLQQMGDLPPSQVPQEGPGQEAKEGKLCEPGPEKHRTQGAQGWGSPLNRHPTDVYRPVLLFNENFVTQLMCLL